MCGCEGKKRKGWPHLCSPGFVLENVLFFFFFRFFFFFFASLCMGVSGMSASAVFIPSLKCSFCFFSLSLLCSNNSDNNNKKRGKEAQCSTICDV